MTKTISQGRYLRYRDKTAACKRCGKSHGVLAMQFDMDRAIEDGVLALRKQIDADLLALMASKG
jgi:hypothetical protein